MDSVLFLGPRRCIDCQHVCGVLEQNFQLLSGRTYDRIVGYFGSPVPVRSNCTDTVLRDINLVEGAQQIIRHVAQVQSCGFSLHPFFHRETHRGLCQRVDSGAISPLFPEVLLFVPYQMNVGRPYVVCKNFVTLCTPAATELTVYFHFLDCNLE